MAAVISHAITMTILLPYYMEVYFFASNMSNESEHSNSKFYYQGQLSDAEFVKHQLTPKMKGKKSKWEPEVICPCLIANGS